MSEFTCLKWLWQKAERYFRGCTGCSSCLPHASWANNGGAGGVCVWGGGVLSGGSLVSAFFFFACTSWDCPLQGVVMGVHGHLTAALIALFMTVHTHPEYRHTGGQIHLSGLPAYIVITHNIHTIHTSTIRNQQFYLLERICGNRLWPGHYWKQVCVCVCCKFNGVCPVWEFLYVWDYVPTLRTGPVQGEVAPLWKVLTVAMRVGQNADMFVRNKASVVLCL